MEKINPDFKVTKMTIEDGRLVVSGYVSHNGLSMDAQKIYSVKEPEKIVKEFYENQNKPL